MRSCLLALGLVACGGEQVLVSSDVRVDQADAGADPESEASRVCSVGDEVFAVWSDARSGLSSIWMNESTDGGVTWLDQPILLNDGAGEAFNPAIACTEDYVFVAWEDTRDGLIENRNIYLARGFRGSGGNLRFGQTGNVQLDGDEDGESHSLRPQVAAHGDSVWVVWSDQRNGAYDIYLAASSDAGELFFEPRRIDSDDAGSAYSALPQIAGNDQLVVVTWEDSRDGLTDIYAATSDNGGLSFGADFRLDLGDAAGSADSFSPRVAVDGEGTAYVAWHDTRNGPGRDVYVNWTSNGGASWAGEPTRVDSDNAGFNDSILPAVGVACGVGHVVWQDARSGGYDIYYRRAIGGAFAAEELRLSGGTRGESNSVDVTLRTDGDCSTASDATVAAVWRDHRDDGQVAGYNDIYYSASTDNGLEFDALDLRLDSLEAGTSFKVDVDVALSAGQLRGVWVDGRSGSADVYFHGLAVGEQASLVPVDAADLDQPEE